jgi:hypothetical protein
LLVHGETVIGGKQEGRGKVLYIKESKREEKI